MILSPARIELKGDQPRSLDYGDIYFASDGQNETQRVFIEPMQLEQLFSGSSETGLRIGELGFGTGLNFLAVCEFFLTHAPKSTRLDYIAFEKHPLARVDLARITKRASPHSALADELTACWPPLIRGWHSRHFASGRIRLLLHYGDALEGVLDLKGRCHAWLLDGFDPACNPEMWHQALLAEVARHSEDGALLATFTAQGEVRRRLESVGFTMRRVDQRPHKRHSLAGVFRGERTDISGGVSEVGVVGAGFAGAFTAHLLALQGVSVHLFDMRSAPMPIALAHARLGDPLNPVTLLRALARSYSNDWYRRLGARSGVLEAPVEANALRRMKRSADIWTPSDDSIRMLGREESRELTKFSGITQSVWHSQCHLVNQEIIERLINHAKITLHREEVASCTAESGHWKLALPGTASQSFERVIICAGAGGLRLLPQLQAMRVAGQMEVASTTRPLPVALIGNGFMAPLSGSQVAFGATYERSARTESQARRENLMRAKQWLHTLGVEPQFEYRGSWRGQRVYHEDRMPIVGEVAAGLYVNTAHGSSGSVLAPLCADLVVSQMLGAPLPLTDELARKVQPVGSRED